ncbi:MAG: hypothetical protein QM734_03125 [Cyclobacteriaceae bacterium]
MLILNNTTDNIQIVLSASATTNQLNCITSYRDLTSNSFVPNRTVSNTNNVADVTIVSTPAGNTQRVVDFISVYNADTALATITINYNANGTKYKLWKGVINSGEKIEYTKSDGFNVLDKSGAVKSEIDVSANPILNPYSKAVLTTPVVNNNSIANTLQVVSGLSFTVTSGHTYYFKFVVPYSSAATATGSRWTITGVTTTRLNYLSYFNLSTTGNGHAINYNSVYGLPSSSSASSIMDGNIAYVEGILKASQTGQITLLFASEVASSAITAEAGGILIYQQII